MQVQQSIHSLPYSSALPSAEGSGARQLERVAPVVPAAHDNCARAQDGRRKDRSWEAQLRLRPPIRSIEHVERAVGCPDRDNTRMVSAAIQLTAAFDANSVVQISVGGTRLPAQRIDCRCSKWLLTIPSS